MSFLDPIWLQRGLDALRETLDVDQTLKQRMIDFLFAEGFWDREKLSHTAAHARFNGCMNPGKPEFFKPAELWALTKRFQRYAFLEAMAEDCGFALVPVPTEARRQALLLRIADAMEQANQVTIAAYAELQRLDSVPPTAPPHPAFREPGGKFALDQTADPNQEPGGF